MNPFTKEHLVLESEHWVAVLHRSQAYLGWCVVYLKRPCDHLHQLRVVEHLDFFAYVLPWLRLALQRAFKPNRINYSCLGNVISQVHWHVIPRYESPRTVAGQEFDDTRYGHNYAPYAHEEAAPEILKAINLELQPHVATLKLELQEHLFFPAYLMKVNDEQSFMQLQQAGRTYDSGWAMVEHGGLVLNADMTVRPSTEREKWQISEIADEYSASK